MHLPGLNSFLDDREASRGRAGAPKCGCDDDRIMRVHPWHGRTVGKQFRLVAGGLVSLVFLIWILF
jgi:hypothetical protein